MIRDTALQISDSFDQLGWNHHIQFLSGDYTINLLLSQMAGDDVLKLFNVLAPNGVPLSGVQVTLSVAGITLT